MSTENNAWNQVRSDHGLPKRSQSDQEGSRWHTEFKRTGGGLYNTLNQSYSGRGRGRGRGGNDGSGSYRYSDNNNSGPRGGRGGRGGYHGRGGRPDSFNSRISSTDRQQSQQDGNWGQQAHKLSSNWNTSSSPTVNDAWTTKSPADTTTDGWSTAARTSNKANEGWGINNTTDGWSTEITPENKDGGSWTSTIDTSNDSWAAPSETTTDVQTDSWSSGMTTAPTSWNPADVSWMKTMDEPEKKETGRGEWKNGRHIIAERDDLTEKKLFGETDADFVHSGINFDQYDNIPIKIEGKEVFEPMNTFQSPPLNEHLLSNIELAQYSKPTPVQKYSVPIVLSGRDLMACAQTGSGKTAGFLFPILSRLFNEGPREVMEKKNNRGYGYQMAYPQVLVLAPTRELATQIYKETKKFSYRSFARPCVAYGGADIASQIRSLNRGCQVLVATPGRLVDILQRQRVSLKNIQHLVLDEADRMLDMGFEPQIRQIVQKEDMPGPTNRQTLMFSATFPKTIQTLAKEFLDNYVFFTVGKVGGASENIKQNIILVKEEDKRKQLLETLRNNNNGLTLVFVETKRMADSLCLYLVESGKPATTIHGDRQQWQREEALQAFKSGNIPILVATAVAARGLDIPNVTHVISFDLPKDIDDYTHRIGRTGRAGNTGLATGFFEYRNRFMAADLVGLLTEAKQTVPDWLAKMAVDYPPSDNDCDDYAKNRQQQRNRDTVGRIGVRISNLKF